MAPSSSQAAKAAGVPRPGQIFDPVARALDVIGDRLTEINVTSPTCAREIEAAYDIDIGGLLMQAIADRLARSS